MRDSEKKKNTVAYEGSIALSGKGRTETEPREKTVGAYLTEKITRADSFDLRILQPVRLLDVLPTLNRQLRLRCRAGLHTNRRSGRDRPFANASQNAAVTDYRQSASAPPLPCRITGKSAKRRDKPFANASQNAAVTDYRQSAAVPPLPCRITGKSAKRRDRPFANISHNAAVTQNKKSDVFLKYHGAKMGFVWYNNTQPRTAKLRRVPTPKGNSEWIK
ncbi:MAG: hypothetical protein RSG53_05670 [Oscillospiraceae bacterium]